MIPLIIESTSPATIEAYLTDKYYLANLVGEVAPENNTIGLPAIKFLIDRAKFAPATSSQAVFLIRDGHLVTPVGQNALLKTLEESKPEEQFIITTTNHHLLLPTICSRCRLIRLENPPQMADQSSQSLLRELITALGSSPSALINFSDQFLSENPLTKLNQIITALRLANRQLPTTTRVKIIDLALTAQSDLERNVNPKLAIDHFLLTAAKLVP